jgi:hypothetical protein
MKAPLKIAVILVLLIFLKSVGIVLPYLGDASTIIETGMYIYFLYTKVPALLNRHFRTIIFRRDSVLRAGLVLVPLFLLLWIGILAPSLFVRSAILTNKTVEFDAAQFLFGSFGGVMIASVIFSMRIRSRHSQTFEKLLRKTESQDDLLIDQAYLKAGGWRKFYVSWQISMQIAFTTFVFFLFWLAVWVIDYAFLIFAGGWICYELFSYLRQTSSGILGKLGRIAKIEEKMLFADTFLIGGVSGSKGAEILGLGAVAIMLSGLFLAVSLKYPFLFLSWLLFCGWYVLILAIEIIRRSNQRIILTREKKLDDITFPAFPQENLAILVVSLLFIVMTMSRYESINLQRRFWPYPLVNPFPNFSLNPMIRALAMLMLLALANSVTIYSALMWAKGRNERIVMTTAMSNITDKLKLAGLCMLGVLLVGSAYTDIMPALLLFVCSLILGLFTNDIRQALRKIAAWKYGVIDASLNATVVVGALLSLWMFCQYNEETSQFFHPLLFPLGLLLSIMTILQGYACYHTQVMRLGNLENKTNQSPR